VRFWSTNQTQLVANMPLAEGRPRKRFQRSKNENEDPRKAGMALPFGRGNGQTTDPKASHARRRSTLRETAKPALLGPRPLESGKRYVF
jgi:hypothetical protein